MSAPGTGIDRRRQLVRAVSASTIGTTVEWYDFFLYNAAAALVFPKIFFPKADPYVATLLAFSTNFAGFAARPLGAAIFGHFGDRIGRKSLLVTTMLLMGVATTLVGVIPSYESIGIWGAILVTILRSVQGIAVGGEWSGSVLMAGEWSDPKHRGFTTSFAQMGAPLGLVVANGSLSLMTYYVSEEAFLSWGWRIPFLASMLLVGLGLWIRLGVLESPVFSKLKERGQVLHAPLVAVLRENWREVLLSTLLRTGQLVPYYVFTTWILFYGNSVLGMDRAGLLAALSIRSTTSIIMIPLAGHLSDLYGRRRIVTIGLIGISAFSFAYFKLVDTRMMSLVFVAMVIDSLLQDLQYAPQAALIAENFPASRRYSGSGLGYHLASITAAGPAPLIATVLYERFHTGMAIAAFVMISAIISLAALTVLKDNSGKFDHE